MTFEQWLAAVDRILMIHVGLKHDDLADHLYYDAFEAGEAPRSVAAEVLHDNGFADIR
ncbi:hypothetical protein SEA_SUPERCHUNK_93 [Mycobacterium phage Superchunk]|nr:hypothetical protein SEA_SUPERCHUNK_93 [Mycobacterium phage Superchunk]